MKRTAAILDALCSFAYNVIKNVYYIDGRCYFAVSFYDAG